MKPSISIDERGVLLHVTDNEGHGIAVPLNRETVSQLSAQLAAAAALFKGPEKSQAWWRLVRAVAKAFSDEDKPK